MQNFVEDRDDVYRQQREVISESVIKKFS